MDNKLAEIWKKIWKILKSGLLPEYRKGPSLLAFLSLNFWLQKAASDTLSLLLIITSSRIASNLYQHKICVLLESSSTGHCNPASLCYCQPVIGEAGFIWSCIWILFVYLQSVFFWTLVILPPINLALVPCGTIGQYVFLHLLLILDLARFYSSYQLQNLYDGFILYLWLKHSLWIDLKLGNSLSV